MEYFLKRYVHIIIITFNIHIEIIYMLVLLWSIKE